MGSSIGEIERQSAVLQRNLELLRRRGDLYREVDRAGYLLLRTLAADGPADISSLSRTLGVDSSTLGRQVAAAEADGLLQRTPAVEDRRHRIVTLTETGRTAMRAVRDRRWKATARMLADWDVHDLETLAEMFARYNDAIATHYLDAGTATRHPRPRSGDDDRTIIDAR